MDCHALRRAPRMTFSDPMTRRRPGWQEGRLPDQVLLGLLCWPGWECPPPPEGLAIEQEARVSAAADAG